MPKKQRIIIIAGPNGAGKTTFACALRRAARRALELGIQTGTPVYVWENNKIVDLTKERRSAKSSKAKRSSR
jgi:adenylate kinase family enzyme